MGDGDRTRAPGLAHRVLRDEHASPRRVVRHPHGGVDLVFPHHEDEIAQSEAATGVPFVRTWLHCAHLRMGGQKMAKSTGNIARVADLLEAGVSRRALRYALIAVHYRQGLDFSEAVLEAAGAALERLDTLLVALGGYAEARADDPTLPQLLDLTRSAFEAAFDDDLNVSAALAAIFELAREANRRLAARSISRADADRIVELLRSFDAILGILVVAEQAALEPELATLLEARAAARAAREWARSDQLRVELAALGLLVEDTQDGQRWRRLEMAR